MSSPVRTSVFLSLVALVSGCPSAAMPDGGALDVGADTSLVDAPMFVLPGGPCESDADCPIGLCNTESETGAADGICRVDCTMDAECPATSHCALGRCRLDCTDSSRCRSGYLCYDLEADGRLECAGAGTGTGGIGDACSGSDECAGGTFGRCLREFGAGYCTDACATDADCGAGAHCGPVGTQRLCFLDCVGDSDCRSGQVCDYMDDDDATTECFGRYNPAGAPSGSLCSVPNTCSGRNTAACITEPTTTFGVCTYPCGPAGLCDPPDHCTRVTNADGSTLIDACLPACTTDADCADGLGCIDANDDGMGECYFSGVGRGVLGDACGNVSDCAGGERATCLHTLGGLGACGLDCRAEACGSGSECLSIAGGRYCVRTCATDGDCATGFRCRASALGMACQP
jgi:hypothetical protein